MSFRASFVRVAAGSRPHMIECGTVRGIRFAAILVLVIFDDNFENIAFQGLLREFRIVRRT